MRTTTQESKEHGEKEMKDEQKEQYTIDHAKEEIRVLAEAIKGLQDEFDRHTHLNDGSIVYRK